MDRGPETYAIRTGGGRSAGLIAVAFTVLVGLVVGLGWFGRGPETGLAVSADRPMATPTASPGDAATTDDLGGPIPAGIRRPVPVVGSIAAFDPQPGTEIPASVRLGVAGRVLTYRPRQVVVRLRVPGRRDVVRRLATEPDGSYSGWLTIADPRPAAEATLDVADGASSLAPSRPLGTIPFRIGAPGVVTIDRPVEPFAEITSPDLVVEGSTAAEVETVVVQLEARNNRVIDHLAVATTGPAGPDGRRRYRAVFELPAVHPNGTMVVDVAPADGIADPDRYRLRLAVVIGALGP
jgi:hypothetical protein